jgi:hypothetical protein
VDSKGIAVFGISKFFIKRAFATGLASLAAAQFIARFDKRKM